MKKLILRSLCLLLFTAGIASAASGPYFGQTPPGTTPQKFASGIISLSNHSEIRVAFSPSGDECFFTRSSPGNSAPWNLYYAQRVNNTWTDPAVATFSPSGDAFTGQPFFSADGNKLYFTHDANILVVDRTPEGWGSPQVLPSPINSSSSDVYYSQTLDGTVYFASDRPGGSGQLDIWRTRQEPNQPLQVENLGALINTSAYDYDPHVDPAGEYLLFASNRSGSSSKVYVSFSDGNDGWNTPVNMNTLISGFNIYAADGPSMSSDGRYLFWRRYYSAPDIYWVENPFYAPGDLYRDGVVNFRDFAILAKAWRSEPGDDNWKDSCDLAISAKIDEGDLAILCNNWLK